MTPLTEAFLEGDAFVIVGEDDLIHRVAALSWRLVRKRIPCCMDAVTPVSSREMVV